MIKEALQYIAGLNKEGTLVDVGERKYSIGHLEAIKPPKTETIKIATLEGLCEWIKTSQATHKERTIRLHIESHTRVNVISALQSNWKGYNAYAMCDCSEFLSSFRFGDDYDPEQFLIGLHTSFEPTAHRALLTKVASSCTKDSEIKTEDDGMTQTTTVGNAIKTKETMPNPVLLKPYRTFAEVAQPESPFVFRIHDGRSGPEMALYEADCGKWKLEAIKSIQKYLDTNTSNIAIFY